MKKKNAVVFGMTKNHVFAVACVMMDLKKFCNVIDEVVVIHDGISEKDKLLMAKILPTRFIVYNFPIDTSGFNKGTLRQFSKMVFSKFECLRLLSDYTNVMWLDYDIIVTKDISSLFEPSVTGIKMMPSGYKVRAQLHEPIEDYDMEAEGISGSTFVFSDHLSDYPKLYNFCYEKLEKYAKYLYLPEQGIFDFMIQEFQLKIEPIDGNIYSPHPKEIGKLENAKIIHAYGQPKFWNGIDNSQWNKNYAYWLKMGGTMNAENKISSKFAKLVKKIPLTTSLYRGELPTISKIISRIKAKQKNVKSSKFEGERLKKDDA
jgi:lipopolysaccharide biosynthesis glycosyltransferase